MTDVVENLKANVPAVLILGGLGLGLGLVLKKKNAPTYGLAGAGLGAIIAGLGVRLPGIHSVGASWIERGRRAAGTGYRSIPAYQIPAYQRGHTLGPASFGYHASGDAVGDARVAPGSAGEFVGQAGRCIPLSQWHSGMFYPPCETQQQIGGHCIPASQWHQGMFYPPCVQTQHEYPGHGGRPGGGYPGGGEHFRRGHHPREPNY